MNCQQLQQQLDDYLDGGLELTEEADLHIHLDGCRSCRQRVQDAREVLVDLKAMQVPMQPGFPQQAVRQAASQIKQRPRRSGFVAGFSSALVAGFALLLVVTGLLPGSGGVGTSVVMPEVAMSITAPQTVNLAFDVAHAIDTATLSIDLPGNVEVVGFPGMKRLSWQTSLTQGRNILPLPLMGTANANGELIATLEQGGKTKILRIKVRVDKQVLPQAEIYKLSWV